MTDPQVRECALFITSDLAVQVSVARHRRDILDQIVNMTEDQWNERNPGLALDDPLIAGETVHVVINLHNRFGSESYVFVNARAVEETNDSGPVNQ